MKWGRRFWQLVMAFKQEDEPHLFFWATLTSLTSNNYSLSTAT